MPCRRKPAPTCPGRTAWSCGTPAPPSSCSLPLSSIQEVRTRIESKSCHGADCRQSGTNCCFHVRPHRSGFLTPWPYLLFFEAPLRDDAAPPVNIEAHTAVERFCRQRARIEADLP